MHRFNVNIGNNLKFGALYHQNMGESGDIYTDKISISLDDVSFFNSAISFDKIILGNFNVAFGQGVVIETTDYFSPRRTGYGFTKRVQGVSADLSRSSQYLMSVASQITLDNPFTSNYSNIKLTLFSSMHPRDAIINQDESFCALITMQPRLEWGINGDKSKINHSLISSVNELTWGGNVRFSPNVSTMLGVHFL